MARFRRTLHSFVARRTWARKCCALLTVLVVLLVYVTLKDSSTVPFGLGTASHLLPPHRSSDRKELGRPGPTGSVQAVHHTDGSSKILLMTYGRSGSTFTSDVLRQDPKVFYTFEPLFSLIRRQLTTRSGIPPAFIQANQEALDTFNRDAVDLVEIFLSCAFESMNISDIHNFQLSNSEDSRLLYSCAQRSAKKPRSPAEIVDCFLQARRSCLSHPIKMVKTIRFRGTAARQILSRHDDLKVLYLIRDPRGTLSSQARVFGAFKWEGVGNYSADYCQVFREDLAIMGELLETYPDRVKILRYETLAASPLKVSEEVYTFLGLSFTSQVKAFIYNRTMAGHKPNHAYGTLRSNSTEAAYSWRSKISLQAAQAIDGNCKDIYEALGYVAVSTEAELKDTDHSLLKPVLFRGHQL
ncbi:carbohydrate sulfotransferase 1-like isoform X2 [Babylonia areolata]|uniref:carbohydrate sulfotransferase 1-like isoform X2 n=1 Tax=Babylonia areolata TaxID=304850 RepID=UPI003FCF59AE